MNGIFLPDIFAETVFDIDLEKLKKQAERREKEINSDEEIPNIDVSIKWLNGRLNEVTFKTDTADNVSKKINDTSKYVKNKMVEFEYYE